MNLTAEQHAAVIADGERFLSAGAGTGKTSVVIARIARAIDEGVAPDRILVVTYTEAAAGELVERLAAALPASVPGASSAGSRVHASTIHGLCARLLREHALAAGLPSDLRVLDEGGARLLAQDAFREAIERARSDEPEIVLELLTDYGLTAVRSLVLELERKLRARGETAAPAPPPARSLAEPLATLREACARMLAGAGQQDGVRMRLARLQALLERDPTPSELANLERFRKRPLHELKDACQAVERVALEHLDVRAHAQISALLPCVRAAYRRAKEREGALDFDDLQERVCQLLETDAAVRATVQEAYDLVLVDEFQDTNGLQCRLLDLVAAASRSRVFVGDEFQSIYRFRDADVGLFRTRRERAAGASALTGNFRSRPEVLAVVNQLFARLFDGAGYRPLVAAADFAPLSGRAAVELNLVPEGAGPMAARREAEAAMIALRLREIVSAGDHAPGDCVILLRAGTDARTYERALVRAGLSAALLIPQRYYGVQAVRDVTAYLALVRNRFDDVALASVLASPLVGISNDGLLALRRAAQTALFYAIQYDQLDGLDDDDRERVRTFCARFEAIVDASQASGLAEIVQRVIDDHDYDLASLVRRDGRQREANLRKLVRLADDFERLRGRDLTGFLESLETLESEAVREGEAVTEAHTDAVRIMTIHTAKGLEFPVVVVADLARASARARPSVAVAADGRVGLTLRDAHGGSVRSPLLEAIADEGAREDEAERRRVLYVALTRAQHRLVLSASLPAPRDTDLGSILAALGIEADALLPGSSFDHGLPDGVVSVRVAADAVTPDESMPELGVAPAIGEQLSLLDQAVEYLPPFGEPPGAEGHRPSTLSFSALDLHERCGYRYHVERVVRLRAPLIDGEPAGVRLGDAVHRAIAGDASPLELLDEGMRARALELIAAWQGSALRARAETLSDVRHELGFAFLERGVVLRGSFDLHGTAADGTVTIVDLKTNRLADEPPAAVVRARYRLQQQIYALAALRRGAPAVELVFCFLERPAEPAVERFGHADAPALSSAVGAAIDRLLASDFAPRPGLSCRDCPALDRLCAGPAL